MYICDIDLPMFYLSVCRIVIYLRDEYNDKIYKAREQIHGKKENTTRV